MKIRIEGSVSSKYPTHGLTMDYSNLAEAREYEMLDRVIDQTFDEFKRHLYASLLEKIIEVDIGSQNVIKLAKYYDFSKQYPLYNSRSLAICISTIMNKLPSGSLLVIDVKDLQISEYDLIDHIFRILNVDVDKRNRISFLNIDPTFERALIAYEGIKRGR